MFKLLAIRLLAKLVAPLVVPFLSDKERVQHPVWGVSDTTDVSYRNIAFRNSCHNYSNRDAVMYFTKGNTDDETLEALKGFQWRKRVSTGGKYKSFRCTWGKPRAKGKREFYIGWTMNEEPKMRLTIQLRPF